MGLRGGGDSSVKTRNEAGEGKGEKLHRATFGSDVGFSHDENGRGLAGCGNVGLQEGRSLCH